MIAIWKLLLSFYKENYKRKPKDFKRGFEKALILLMMAIKKHPKYNLVVQNHELLKYNSALKKELNAKTQQIQKLQLQLGEKFLISNIPTQRFREFELETSYGNFRIVINAAPETLKYMYYLFSMTATYKSADECKLKFLVFIKTYSSMGFTAYKNLITYKKLHNHDN